MFYLLVFTGNTCLPAEQYVIIVQPLLFEISNHCVDRIVAPHGSQLYKFSGHQSPRVCLSYERLIYILILVVDTLVKSQCKVNVFGASLFCNISFHFISFHCNLILSSYCVGGGEVRRVYITKSKTASCFIPTDIILVIRKKIEAWTNIYFLCV